MKIMKGYVYEILNIINGKKYIGVSMKCDDNKSIKNAIEKYGKDNFEKKIIKMFDSEIDARNYEKYLIEE